MRNLVLSPIVATLLTLLGFAPARADVPPRGQVVGTVVDEGTGQPIAGATAILTPERPSPQVVAATSDAAGRFVFRELPAGSYALLVLFGDARRSIEAVAVGNDQTVAIQAPLALSSEVITIREKKPLPVTQPKPVASTVKPILPYTDAAIGSNDWQVGWLLLDVSAGGEVTGFRFLHRPDRGLDEIARKEVWRLRFDPARDANGRAVAAQILWRMEWPSYWWYRERVMVASPDSLTPEPDVSTGNSGVRGPEVSFLTPRSKTGVQLPPCRGSAPLNLDLGTGVGQRRDTEHLVFGKHIKGAASLNGGSSADSGVGIGGKAVYRDCSPPDRDRATTEPLIPRP